MAQAPVITGGNVGDSRVITVTGIGEPECTPHATCVFETVEYAKNGVCVFDCGPDRICHDVPPPGDDFPLAVVSASVNDEKFFILLAKPLVPGQEIYVTDGCTDPVLSQPVTVVARSVVPLMSHNLMVVLVAALGLVGLLRLYRLRRSL